MLPINVSTTIDEMNESLKDAFCENPLTSCEFYNVVPTQTGECDICMEIRDMEWIECARCKKSLCEECFSNLKKVACPSCRFKFITEGLVFGGHVNGDRVVHSFRPYRDEFGGYDMRFNFTFRTYQEIMEEETGFE